MKMKRLYMLPLMAFLAINVSVGQTVDHETARSVAETFFKKNVLKDRGSQNIHFDDITAETEFHNFYIFSADSGFVLVAGDERVIPILGYSKTGPFVTEDMPENLRWWLRGYDEQIQNVKDKAVSATPEISSKWSCLKAGQAEPLKDSRSMTLPLNTRWGQGSPYNDKCPIDPDGHPGYGQKCVTGCAATAVAQIMKYWKHPTQGFGELNLTVDVLRDEGNAPRHSSIYPIYVNFSESTYDWSDSNMPNQLSSNQTQIDAVSNLMSDVGIAMHMNYCSKGSNAYLQCESMINYFDYSPALHFEYLCNYHEEQWINMLKQEINSHRPVYYRGQSDGGGHAFIFLGYDDIDNFLVNWGWGGDNAYFPIGQLNPASGGIGGGNYDFNQINAAALHLMPNDHTLNPPASLSVHNTISNELVLEWPSVPNAASYVILRNGRFLAETSMSNYTDEGIYGGTFTYQVITIGENHRASIPSEGVTYTKAYDTPSSSSVLAFNSGNTVELSWEASSNTAMSLYHHKSPYDDTELESVGGLNHNLNNECYEVFHSSELSPYTNQYITCVACRVSSRMVGQLCKIRIIKGRWPDSYNVVQSHQFFPTSTGLYYQYLNPIIIENEDDIVIEIDVIGGSYQNPYDCVGGGDMTCSSLDRSLNKLATGKHFIVDLYAKWADELTYNVYRSDGQNTICIARDLEEPYYTDANLSYGTYSYYVTTNYYGGESEPSDYVTVSIGTGQHSITCASTTHGSLSASPSLASANTTVTVTATPEQGYSLSQLYYTESGSSDNHYIPHSTGQFVMPDANVTVHAEFASNELTIDNLEELIEFRNRINEATMGGFEWKGNHVNDFGIGSVFYLTNDIDINPGYVFTSDGWYTYTGGGNAPGVERWTTIGQIVTPPESWDWQGGSVSFIGGFGGTFEGNGHTISGLYINGTNSYQALFSYLLPHGTIRNLTVNNAFVGGQDYSAIICAVSSGNIENCHSYGTVLSYRGAGIAAVSVGTVQGSGKCIINCTNHAEMKVDNAGGICLGMVDGLIQGCTNYGPINANTTADCWTCGGIVGKAVNGRLVDNTNYGAVRGNKAGGIVGELIDSSIMGCANVSQVSASGDAAKLGGIVGEFSTHTTQTGYFYVFSSNTNAGDVQGNGASVGGLVGNLASGNLYIGDSHSSGSLNGAVAGGVLGHAAAGLWQIDDSYNTGAVAGTSDAGGILGKMTVSGNVYDSFNQGDVTGSNNKGGLIGYVSSGTQSFVLNNCSNSGTIGGSDQGNAGGLIGATARKGTLASCTNTGAVSNAAVSGGLIGVISGGNWSMNGLANTFGVNGTTSGGIIGSVAGGSVTFNDCSNQASLSLTGGTVGGILGSLTGGSAFFNNCQNGAIIQGTYSGGTMSGTIGGILGMHTGGAVSFYECQNNGQLIGNMVGGIMAHSTYTNGTIDIYDCSNTGPLNGSATAGGIVGVSNGEIEFTDCSNGASVHGGSMAGGIIGLADGQFTMSGCYNTQTVQDNYAIVGGLVGQNGGTGVINDCFNQAYIYGVTSGGLIGAMNATCDVTNSYNEGSIDGDGTSGGFFGEVNADVVMNADKNCYNTARVGGLVSGTFAGYISAEHVYISDWDNNYSSGILIQPDGGCWGGIVGILNASEEAVISNCNNRGSIWLDGTCGGIVCDGEGNLTISNCYNYGSFRGSVGSTAGGASGIIGHWSGNLTIEDCTNDGIVTASDATYAAGIVASFEGGNLTLANCINRGAITASSASGSAGGIVSAVTGASNNGNLTGFSQSISNCVNYGTIRGSNSSGILSVLMLTQNLDVNGCYNHGKINGSLCSGIMGMVIDHMSYGGQVVGIQADIEVSDCHNFGNLTSSCGMAGVGPLSIYEIAISSQSSSEFEGQMMDSDYSTVIISDCSNSGNASMSIEGENLSTIFGSDFGGVNGGGYGISGAIGAQVTNCNNTGNIEAAVVPNGVTFEADFTGVVKAGEITDCFNSGHIATNYGDVAGIALRGLASKCYNTGSLKGDDVSGIIIEADHCAYNVNYGNIEPTGTCGKISTDYGIAPIVSGIVGLTTVGISENELKVHDNINTGTFNMDATGSRSSHPVVRGVKVVYADGAYVIRDPENGSCDRWVSNNYYDEQMCLPYYVLSSESSIGRLTQNLLGTALENYLGSAKDGTVWIFTDGLYPRLDDSPVSELGATPALLQDNETAFALATDFLLGSLTEGEWTASNGKINISGTTASVVDEGEEVLSLTRDGITKDLVLYSANAFVADGSWNTASNWSMNSVPGASQRALVKANAVIDSEVAIHDIVIEGADASVCINDGFTLQPEGVVDNHVGPEGLLIKDGGQFIHEGYHVLATYQKSIEGFSSVDDGHWYTVSVPFWEVNLDEECNWNSGEYDLYVYCEECIGEEWRNVKMVDASEVWLYQGEGYLYANSATALIEASGWLNDEEVYAWVGCSEREDALKGFNLIGNPFAHEIYKGAGAAIDDANMASGYYVLDNSGAWELKTYEDAIGVGQGILVKTTASSEVWIEKTTAPASGESGLTKSRSGEIGLSLSGEGQVDAAYIYLFDGIGLNKIGNFDKKHCSLYLRNEGEDYAIVHIDPEVHEMPVGFKTGKSGRYEIDFKLKGDFDYIHLIDNKTGEDVNLLSRPHYAFSANESDFAIRFKLVFLTKDSEEENDNIGFAANGNFIIPDAGSDAIVQLIDVMGHVLRSERAAGSCEMPLPQVAGVYLVRLVEKDSVKVQKIIIK